MQLIYCRPQVHLGAPAEAGSCTSCGLQQLRRGERRVPLETPQHDRIGCTRNRGLQKLALRSTSSWFAPRVTGTCGHIHLHVHRHTFEPYRLQTTACCKSSIHQLLITSEVQTCIINSSNSSSAPISFVKEKAKTKVGKLECPPGTRRRRDPIGC